MISFIILLFQIFLVSSQPIVEESIKPEIYLGTNIGKLLRVAGKIWLQDDFEVLLSFGTLSAKCPPGYIVPNHTSWASFISSLGSSPYSALTNQLNYKYSYNYLSSTCSNGFYAFDSIKLSIPDQVSWTSTATRSNLQNSKVKCLLEDTSKMNNITIKGRPFDPLELGLSYEWEILEPNAKSVLWDLGNGTKTNLKKINFFVNAVQNRTICVDVSIMGWFTKHQCFEINIVNPSVLSRSLSEIVTFTEDIIPSSEDEIIEGQNYGKLLKVGTQLWISKDVPVSVSYGSLNYQCPINYRAPSAEEYFNIFSSLGYSSKNVNDLLIGPAKFNSSLYYMTTTNKNGMYLFTGLSFDGNNVKMSDLSTYSNSQKMVVRCIRNRFDRLSFMLPELDFAKGTNYPISLEMTNVISYKWVIGTQTVSTSKSMTFNAPSLGKYKVCVTLSIFSGFILNSCQNIVVNMNSEADRILKPSIYHSISIPNINVNIVRPLHFSWGTAPLAPNSYGNSYVACSEKDSGKFNVIEILPNGVINPNFKCDLSRIASPIDIIATSWGFAAYIVYPKNYNKNTLLGVYRNCSIKFEKLIMNNEIGQGTPKVLKEQIKFYNDAAGNLEFGMSCMYAPANSRLTYAKGRIVLVFGHTNHFNVDDHTSATFISFDENNPEDAKLGYSWGSSHSLIQSLIFDGEKFLAGSLSDGGNGIHVARCEGVVANSRVEPITNLRNRLDCKWNTHLIEGLIPGWMGYAAGRLGGLVALDENNIVAFYSRTNSSVGVDSLTQINTKNEIGFVMFDKNLTVQQRTVIEEEVLNNALHSALYGNNLLVGFSLSQHRGDFFPALHNFLAPALFDDEEFFLKLVDRNGLSKGKIKIPKLPSSDDFEVLNDGRVAWISFDSSGSLTYHYLDPIRK